MYEMFKLSRISKKNTGIIVSAMVAVTIAFLCVLLPMRTNLSKQEIRTIEDNFVSGTQATLETELSNITNSMIFLSTIKLKQLDAQFSSDEYKDFLNIKNQILAAQKSMMYISDVYVFDELTGYSTNEEQSYQDVKEKTFEEIFFDKGLHFLYEAEGQEYYIRYDAGLQSNNSVYYKLNRKDFSNAIFTANSGVLFQGIADLQGQMIFAEQSEYQNKQFSDVMGVDFDKEYSVRKVMFQDRQGYLTTENVDALNLSIVRITDTDIYNVSGQKNIVYSVLLVVLFLGLALGLTSLITNITYRPFKGILNSLDFEQQIVGAGEGTEYDYIMSRIGDIKSDNANLNEEVRDLLKELNAQQFIACQTQICPHFLSNTLSAISGLSVLKLKDRNNEIVRTINNLSIILDSTLKLDRRISTIREEVEITNVYIDILYTRYANTFFVEWDVDTDLWEHYIIKFSLQPIIENAVHYAFSGTSGERIIRVSINHIKDKIVVSVKDNGVGIETKKLKSIIASANDFTTRSEHGIGLRNVNHRIKLLYGDEYGLKIRSVVGEGTEVLFSYPYE